MRKKNTKLREWQIKAQTSSCETKGCASKMRVTVDHIIPQHLLDMLGLEEEKYEDEENFQLLCGLCNHMKANRLDHLNPKTVPLLKKYVAIYEEKLLTGSE